MIGVHLRDANPSKEDGKKMGNFKPNAKVSSKMTHTPKNSKQLLWLLTTWSGQWASHDILTQIPPVADFEGTNGDLDIEAERVMVGAKHDDDISQVKATNIKRIK